MNRFHCVAALALLCATCLVHQLPAPVRAQTQQQIKISHYVLSTFEDEMVKEINLARTRPQEYATYLEELRPYFNGKTLQLPGRPGFATQEGVAALDEAVSALRQAQPLGPYNLSQGMCLGANVLIRDQGAKGLTGHKCTDGSFCEQRLQQFGSYQGTVGENLSYGNLTARQRIMTLLIDDGFATRDHRNRLLSKDYKVVGVSCGDHAQLDAMCVITFAEGYADGPGRNAAFKF